MTKSTETKRIKTGVLIALILILGATVFYQYWLLPRLSAPLRQQQILSSVQERTLWPDLGQFRISEAVIAAEQDQQIVLQFSYHNLNTDALTQACGTIKNIDRSDLWGCTPIVLQQRGSGEFQIRYSLVSQAPPRVCSDRVVVDVYDSRGSVIYEHEFNLAKVWHQESGPWSWYQYRKHGCDEFRQNEQPN